MDTECSQVGASLARYPEDKEAPVIVKLNDLALVDLGQVVNDRRSSSNMGDLRF